MQPERIGRFPVVRLLGSGAFATVWLVRDEDLSADVAVKILAENWSRNEDARRRFLDEARALRALESDRIVRVYEVGKLEDDRPYMVMEYADRGSLQERMEARAAAGERYSVEEAVALAAEIAECLAAAHDLGIIHRDLKPGNVLFRSIPPERQEAMRREGKPVAEERLLLGDFGIARRLEGAMPHTRVVGTPHYMAPEQAEPDTAALADERSDVFSAAVVLYEVLAGQVPFPFDSITQVLRAQMEQGSPPITRFRPDVSPALASVVHRGLAADPQYRFVSAREWRDALRAAATGEAPPPAPAPGAAIVGVAGAPPGGPPAPPPRPIPPRPVAPPVPVPAGAVPPPGAPPPPAPPGGAPPPGRPPAAPPPRRRSNRPKQLVALLLVLLLGAGIAVFVGTQQSAAAQILLQPANSTAPDLDEDGREDPFTLPLDPEPDEEEPEVIQTVPKVTAKVRGVSTELFGGTGKISQCAKEKLIDFLTQNRDKAGAWAKTLGVAVGDIPSYVRSLLPVEANVDLRVTNHGFASGVAQGFQSVLERGTALLVDALGVPVVRCKCGNPLLPPEEVEEPEYIGDAWAGFDPEGTAEPPAPPAKPKPKPGGEFGVYAAEFFALVGTLDELAQIEVCELVPGSPCGETIPRGEFRRLLGPFGSEEEATEAFCSNIVPGSVRSSPFGLPGISATLAVDGQEYDITHAPACPGITPSPSPTVEPTPTEEPTVTNLSRSAVPDASSSTEGYSPLLGVDGLVDTSWFSAGKKADGDVTTYTLFLGEPSTVTRITFVGNEHHPEFPTGFGFNNWTIELKDASGNTLLEIESPPGQGIFTQTANIPDTPGVVAVLFTGFDRESDDCGGFAELKVFGYPTG